MKLLVLALLLRTTLGVPQYRFDAWTTETGLPQNSVTSLVQTRDGYLWLATSGGLVRFDGVKFTVLEAEPATGLRSVRIHALAEDHAGALWIATEHGGVTRYANGSFTTYLAKDGLPINSVQLVHVDRRGTIWLSTIRGLVRFERERFTTLTTADGLPATYVTTIADDEQGHVWLGTSSGLA